jgi:hypothetical protein
VQRRLVYLVLQSTDPRNLAASVAAWIAARKAWVSSAGSAGSTTGSGTRPGGGTGAPQMQMLLAKPIDSCHHS